MSYKDACAKEQDSFIRMAGLMAYIAFAAGETALRASGSRRDGGPVPEYRLPLIYTLFHMEDEGIAVRREETQPLRRN